MTYDCPFCRIVAGDFAGPVESRPEDVVLREDAFIAFVGSRGFGDRPGHLLVVPTVHVEALGDLSEAAAATLGAALPGLARVVQKTYDAEGLTLRQHNGTVSGQDVWHVHFHLIPRWAGDRLYDTPRIVLASAEREAQALALRDGLKTL